MQDGGSAARALSTAHCAAFTTRARYRQNWPLCRNFDILDPAGRWRNRKAIFAHAVEVELDGIADFSFNLGNGCPCGDAARKVWNVGGEVAFGTLNYDGISHMASLFQIRLLQDAVLRARSKVIAWLARNSDPTGLARVLELAVTAAGCYQMPTIVLQQPEDFAHLHERRIAGQLA